MYDNCCTKNYYTNLMIEDSPIEIGKREDTPEVTKQYYKTL
jgi:hypothetical protein